MKTDKVGAGLQACPYSPPGLVWTFAQSGAGCELRALGDRRQAVKDSCFTAEGNESENGVPELSEEPRLRPRNAFALLFSACVL